MALEVNEVLALVFVIVAAVGTLLVRAQPSNTPRTREWWGRFLVFVGFLLAAQIATNVEQFFPETDPLARALNILEHASLVAAAAWALALAVRGLAETYARHGTGEGGAA